MAENYTEEKAVRTLKRLTTALDSGTQSQVRRLVNSLASSEIGELLEALPPAKRLVVWDLVDPEYDGEVLVHVNDEVRASLIQDMTSDELVAASGSLDLDDLADILEDLPETVVNEVLRIMDREDRERLVQVMAYPEDSAGGLMNPDVITVRQDVTLDVVMRYLRLRGELPEHVDQLLVVNRTGKYQGRLRLVDLLTRDPDLTVAEVIDTRTSAIPVTWTDTEVAREFENHDLISAPVVDENNNLLGRITIDDVVDVIREEAEHSVLTMAGLDEDDDMFAPVIPTARRRWIWLGVNLVTALLAALVLYLFEPTLDQVVALAILFPVVMSMGGIAGTQTLTLMIRGMATGQVGASNTPAMLKKELAVGILNGLVFSVVVAAIAIFWYQDIGLGIVMGAAIIINLLAGAAAGAVIPVVLKRLSIDPALAGGVVLTTVTDVIGIFAFVGLASLILIGN